jgi:hypothetical protein
MDPIASSRLAPRSVLRFLSSCRFAAATLIATLVLCARPGAVRADDDERREGGGDEWGGREGDSRGRWRHWNDGEHDDGDDDAKVSPHSRERYEAPRYDPSLGEFRDSLSPYGEWIDTPEYGTVWRPAVDDGWRPYFRGRWAWTAAGWYWVADEPFGWAVYHYGRWAYLDGIGWSWLPGHRWAPAWVAWRWGDGYAGWCPLGPRGYVYSRPVDYVIVQQQFFLAPVPHHAVPLVAAASFFPLTRAVPVVSPGPHAGPVVQAVAHAAGREVRPLDVVDVRGGPRSPTVQPFVGPHGVPPHTQPSPGPRGGLAQRVPRVRPYVAGVPRAPPIEAVHPAPRPLLQAAPMARPAARQATQTR